MSEIHCWKSGPEAPDGCSTTCMLLDEHDGLCEWTRDDEITIQFAPAKRYTASKEEA